MKILHLLKSSDYSGAENVVISMIRHNKNDDIVYASTDGPIRKVLKANHIEFCPIERLTVPCVQKVIHNIQPTIIHAHDFTASVLAALSAHTFPIVSHLHNNPHWMRHVGLKSLAFYALSKRFARILAVSKAIENEYVFSGKIASKTTIIGNVVDRELILEKAKMETDIPYCDICFLGRLTEQKDPLTFCRIVMLLKERLPHIRAKMIGSGELAEQVHTFIEKNGLHKQIDMVGFQENPYVLLNKAKLLIMPSRWEGFGLAAVEAMCLGKPVLCSGAGGLADIVTPKCGAILDSPDAYADEAHRLLTDDAYYAQIRNGAIARSSAYCDWGQYMERIESIYEGALQSCTVTRR